MLTTGTKLGRYEVVAPLGAGGRGEVELFWRRELVLSEAEGSRQAKSRAERGIAC